jgi:hypothetical protein
MRLAIPVAADVEEREGLRILKLPAALIGCSPTHFANHSIQMRSALAMVSDASEVLGRLLDGGHSNYALVIASRFVSRYSVRGTRVDFSLRSRLRNLSRT